MCRTGEAVLVWSLLVAAVCSVSTGHPIQPTEMRVMEAHQRYKECPRDVCRGLPCYNYEVYLVNPLEEESLCTCLPCGHPSRTPTTFTQEHYATAAQKYLGITNKKSHNSNDNKGSLSKVRRYRRSLPKPPKIPKAWQEAPGVGGSVLFPTVPTPEPDVPIAQPVIDPLPVLPQI